MLVRMAGNTSVAVILMFLAGVQAQARVTLSSQSLCAASGSTVKIPCTYTTGYSAIDKEWYQISSSDGEERVLSKDPRYSERVYVSRQNNRCELTVQSVGVNDSGVYNFRFRTWPSEWISAPSGVNLTVTELQVKVDPKTVGQRNVKLICSSTCSLSERIYWYRNKQRLWYNHASIEIDSTNPYAEGSYSCEVSGRRSPSLCIFGKVCWGVTYTPEHVCALKGSSVDLSCTYKYPAGHRVTKSLWFIKEREGAEPVDVREEKGYQGRVQYTPISQNDCSVRISDLRESDAQKYRFRFHTNIYGGRYSGTPGVTLSVTDLKITTSYTYYGLSLVCSNTCISSTYYNYIWYKNGEPVPNTYGRELYVSDWSGGSYTCAARGHEELRSPAVCVIRDCWSVSYYSKNLCALIGSSVDIYGYYTFPDQQPEPQPVWYRRLLSADKELSRADDRVEFFGDRANMSTLRLKNLSEGDSAEYFLQIKPPHWQYTSSSTVVSLIVTGLQVKVQPVTMPEEQTVTLQCSSTCSLANNPTYVWYKNGQRVIPCNSILCSVARVSGAVSYCCAVEGREDLLSPPVYSPKSTTALTVSSRKRVEGDSVTLTCSSDANPPVLTYSWFKQRAAADVQLGTGQNYSINNISSEHSGFYYCTARNQLGQHSSTPVQLDVLYSPRCTRAVIIPSEDMLEGGSVTLNCSSDANPPVLRYSWFKQRAAADVLLAAAQNYSISNISSQHSGFYYCTAHNQLGRQNSTRACLDVLYPPRPPSVFKHVSGSLVTLECVSDSNPVSSYTWYRKRLNDSLQIGNSTNLTVDAGAHDALYCMATNRYGFYSSAEWPFTSDNTSAIYASLAVIVVLLLTIIAAFLWMRRRTGAASSKCEKNSEKVDSAPVYCNVSALAMTSGPSTAASSDDQNEIHYASVHFTRSHEQEDPLYSCVQLPGAPEQEEEVEYTTVNTVRPRAVQNDESAIYSTVQ